MINVDLIFISGSVLLKHNVFLGYAPNMKNADAALYKRRIGEVKYNLIWNGLLLFFESLVIHIANISISTILFK